MSLLMPLLSLSKRLIIILFFVCTSLVSSADWKYYFDRSDLIALVECEKISEKDEKVTILKCYKGELNIGDEVKLTSYFRNEVGIFGRSKFIIFANSKDEIQSQVIYDLDVALKLRFNKTRCNLYDDNQHTPSTSLLSFLDAYKDTSLRPKVCQKILRKLKRTLDAGTMTLYLMELYILDFNKYDPIFERLLKFQSASVQYALIHVLGNIHTNESRSLLVWMLSSEKMWLVGMTIQILANESPEVAGPILLEHFKQWSPYDIEKKSCDNRKYDDSMDWGVYNGFFNSFGDQSQLKQEKYQSSMGKWEIIEAFGKLRYEPAAPYLVSFLNHCDWYTYPDVLNVLMQIGNQYYAEGLSELINSNNYREIDWISKKIIDDSIVDCLPSLINFISRLDRNAHCDLSYLISPKEGLGAFSDSLTKSFLVRDFDRFLDNSSSLKCNNIDVWNTQYIATFSKNKDERARPLINRFFLKTFGINEDFGKYPELFRIKKALEDSAGVAFQKKLENSGYKWFTLKRCVAFIDNPQEVSLGKKPKVHFAVEYEATNQYNSIAQKDAAALYTEIIQKELGLPKESISIIIGNYLYAEHPLPAFTWIASNTWEKPLLFQYSSFFIAQPTKESINLFQGILDNGYVKRENEMDAINQAISDMKTILHRD